ncbi:hypothetical protein WG66_009664 [Moniliophthora roreri]|nr:hypothetical protein WG66_009664 [Moniliophthora roreri]
MPKTMLLVLDVELTEDYAPEAHAKHSQTGLEPPLRNDIRLRLRWCYQKSFNIAQFLVYFQLLQQPTPSSTMPARDILPFLIILTPQNHHPKKGSRKVKIHEANPIAHHKFTIPYPCVNGAKGILNLLPNLYSFLSLWLQLCHSLPEH